MFIDEPGIRAVLIAVKAVPGARTSEIAGRLGERLKVRVAAPPEDGKANRAICELLAGALGVRDADVSVVRGHGNAEKTVRIAGKTAADLERVW
ncbi:MAG: DUF167 domain-containing protein [Phycisphaerales bacterium]|nr:DUF167 domain-containing protein [Phycisphaerales bacterium]